MGRNIHIEYGEWLINDLNPNGSHHELLDHMYRKSFSFMPNIPIDSTWKSHGLSMFCDFLEEIDDGTLPVLSYVREYGVSFLEVCILLAKTSEYENSARYYKDVFWEMMDNCGLIEMDDNMWAADYGATQAKFFRIVNKIIEKRTGKYCRSGLFPRKKAVEEPLPFINEMHLYYQERD